MAEIALKSTSYETSIYEVEARIYGERYKPISETEEQEITFMVTRRKIMTDFESFYKYDVFNYSSNQWKINYKNFPQYLAYIVSSPPPPVATAEK